MTNSTDPTGASPGSPALRSSVTGDSGPGEVTIRLDHRSVRKSAVTVFILAGVFLLALWLYSEISHFLFLIILAWLFAIALEPGIRALIKRGRSRGTGAAIMGGGAIVIGLVLAVVFGQLFFTQAGQFAQSVPALASTAIDWVNAHFGTTLDASSLSSSLSLSPEKIASWAGPLSSGVLGVVGSLSAVLFDAVTVLVFGFYFAADGPHFFNTLASWMPQRAQKVFLNVSEIAIAKTGGYVISKIILASLSALFHGIFFFAIGVPNWLPFALVVGITAQFVPIVGTYIGVALPVLAVVFDAPWKAIAIIVFATIYQQIETYFFTPRVSKKTMDLNPAIALAAVFVGGAIWGPLGALIGIPLAAAAVAILDTYKRRYDIVPEIQTQPGAAPSPLAE
jgi:predicted PurR-regulated permease PerM